jgi:hypothetical protein
MATANQRRQTRRDASNDDPPDLLIVGAGFAGMYMLIKARLMGLRALAIEAAPSVGGTWYHNRYPGARVDVLLVGIIASLVNVRAERGEREAFSVLHFSADSLQARHPRNRSVDLDGRVRHRTG